MSGLVKMRPKPVNTFGFGVILQGAPKHIQNLPHGWPKSFQQAGQI